MAGQELTVSEEQAFELLAHLVASAELCITEPYYYGTFRLIDAASKLAGFLLAGPGDGSREWLEHFKTEVDAKKEWMMWDREGYFDFLRAASGDVAGELKRRVGRPPLGTADGAGTSR
ncbi:MAG TPA: DUF6092 family protein [Thermomicrobiaceae bacterium]|nr:DUF6092 family protein [Thermomicrobiaceae bacterium]